MSTWSNPADIEKLRAAYRALLCGEAVLTVRFSGPPERQVTYQQADRAAMKRELDDIDRSASPRPRVSYAITRKGL